MMNAAQNVFFDWVPLSSSVYLVDIVIIQMNQASLSIFVYTASDQKLDSAKAWELRFVMPPVPL